MCAGTHLHYMPPGARIAGHHNGGLCLVRQNGPSDLLHFFTQIGACFAAQDLRSCLLHLQQAIAHDFVFAGSTLDALEKLCMQFLVVLVFGAFDETQHTSRNKALAQLRESKARTMPYKLM